MSSPEAPAPEATAALGALSHRYPAIFCDVWGVLHNGVEKHPAAERALLDARRQGCRVVLVTNSPRLSDAVAGQLDGLAISREAYDAIVTSGDVTLGLVAEAGRKLLHIGPARDRDLFAGLDLDLCDEAEAEAVVATGLFDDERETPDTYAPLLSRLQARGLAMICANPDVMVQRGERLVFCAGAVAQAYAALGGRVLMAGKPHPPIYAAAARAAGVASPREVLAVGDGLHTDIRGANDYGADVLLIVEGVHAAELGGTESPGARLGEALSKHGLAARFFMPALA